MLDMTLNSNFRQSIGKAISNSMSPMMIFNQGSPTKLSKSKSTKWTTLKPWFVAHNIHKMDNSFVVSV